MCFDDIERHRHQPTRTLESPAPTYTKQDYSTAAFESLGLTDTAVERVQSLWLREADRPHGSIVEFVMQHMQERAHLVPEMYLIGLGALPHFAETLGVTGELLQLAVDLFLNEQCESRVMPTMLWLETAIMVRWDSFVGDS